MIAKTFKTVNEMYNSFPKSNKIEYGYVGETGTYYNVWTSTKRYKGMVKVEREGN